MYITKAQSRIIATATLFIFFLLVFALSRHPEHSVVKTQPNSNSDSSKPNNSALDSSEDSKSPSSIVLNQFHRSENKDGRLVWEVIAERGRYFPENNQARLEEATIWFYRGNGSKVELKSKTALLFLQGSSLIKAEAQNGVTMNYDNQLFLSTDSATYNKEENSINAPGVVNISSEQVEISGEGLHANVETQDMTLERDVKTVVKARTQSVPANSKKQSKS